MSADRPPLWLVLAPVALAAAYLRPDWIAAVFAWPVVAVLRWAVQRGMP